MKKNNKPINYKKLKKTANKKYNINILKVNNEYKIIPLIFNLLMPVFFGILVGYINKDTISTYELLKKPVFNPQAIVFQIVWPILYILMGLAAYRIYIRNKQGIDDKGAYFSYLIQLLVNYMWSFIFFTFRLYGIAFICSVILFILIVITFIKFIRIDKISGILLIPYLAWTAFAQVLSFYIWMLNEM